MWLQMFYEWAAKRVKPKPQLRDELLEESDLLLRDTIERELQLIDDRHKIEANREKAAYLLSKINEV